MTADEIRALLEFVVWASALIAAAVVVYGVCREIDDARARHKRKQLDRLRWRGELRVVRQVDYAGRVCWWVQENVGFWWVRCLSAPQAYTTEADAVAAADVAFAKRVASETVVRE